VAGPDRPTRPETERDQGVPGHFVSADLRSDCARFLDDVKSIVARRRDAEHEAELEPAPKPGSAEVEAGFAQEPAEA
jgi:hypothetical protein